MTISTREELDIYTVGVEISRIETEKLQAAITVLDAEIDEVLEDLAA